MPLNVELFDKIERFLSGAMPAEESISFEEEIQRSSELKRIVHEERLTREYDLRSQLDLFVNQEAPHEFLQENTFIPPVAQAQWIKHTTTTVKVFRYAASIIALLGISYLIGLHYKTTNLKFIDPSIRVQLATEASETEVFAGPSMVSNDTLCDCGQGLRKLYNEGFDSNYYLLNRKLDRLNLQDNNSKMCKLYWKAWVYIQKERYDLSIQIFEEIVDKIPVSEFRQRVQLGMMRGMLMNKNDKRLLEVADEVLKENVYYEPTNQFAKKVKLTFK